MSIVLIDDIQPGGAFKLVDVADLTPDVDTDGHVLTGDGAGNVGMEAASAHGDHHTEAHGAAQHSAESDAAALHDNVAGEIAAITEKVTPVSADLLVIEDSAAANVKKRVQVGNLPGGGAALTVQEEDGTPIDTAVTIIRVPNGGLVDNGAGDVSMGYAIAGAAPTAHGIAAHTDHANWKALYTDGSGDEQELPLGAAPSATLGHTYFRSAGAAAPPVMAQEMKTISITVESPVAADSIAISYFFQAVTIREIQHAVKAATNCIWNIEKRSTRGGAGTDINSTDFTSTTTDANAASFSAGGVSADSWLVLAVTSVSGTPGEVSITIRYTVD